MMSLDLKDAYLQVPIHPDSRKYLRFVAFGQVYQFKVLCFGFSIASQVFTRVMAPVLTFLHHAGIRIRRYLDDWLIQAASQFSGSASVGCSSPVVSFSGNRRQLGEVASGTCAAYDISWRSSGLSVFQSFACPKES